jgi:hypothetical protein
VGSTAEDVMPRLDRGIQNKRPADAHTCRVLQAEVGERTLAVMGGIYAA